METILALIDGFGDDPVVTLAVLGLAGGALAAYVVFGFARDRQDLRRRAAAGTDIPEPARTPGKPERLRSLEWLVSFIDENIAGDTRQNRVLRRQLIQAGFSTRAPAPSISRRGSALPSSSALAASSSCPCSSHRSRHSRPRRGAAGLPSSAIFCRLCICAGASRSGSSRTAWAFRISWT